MTTYRQCELVKDALGDFFDRRQYRRLVNGVGLARSQSADWYFKILLRREPTEKQWKSLPTTWQGIHVEYDVVGEIYAL